MFYPAFYFYYLSAVEGSGLPAGNYDVVVVGGGPGGYPLAIILGRSGLRVALIDEDRIGGECTNYGCVPTKSIAHYAHVYREAVRLRMNPSVNPSYGFEYAGFVASEVSKGITRVLESSGVEIIHGSAKVYSSRRIEVSGTTIHANRVVIATGSDPFIPPGISVDGVYVHDNRSFLRWRPEGGESVIIVGGGYIGVEYSMMLSMLGFRVTLVEALNRLLPSIDRDLSLLSRRVLSSLGVRVLLSNPVRGIDVSNEGVRVLTPSMKIQGDIAIVAIGRKPRNREAIRAGLRVDDKGFVITGDCGRAGDKFYVAGDLAGPPLLAHKAIHESISIAQCILGEKPHTSKVIPSVIYGSLDLVSVGLTLAEAKSRGLKAVEVRVPVGGNAKNRIVGSPLGFAKIIYEESSKRIIGVHMAFPFASEVAPTAVELVEQGVRVDEASTLIFPHPTSSESLGEALLASMNLHVHVTGVRRRGV